MDFRHPTMLDFTNKKAAPSKAGFSLDKRDLLHRSQMRRREWRAVVTLPLAIVAVALFIHFMLKMRSVDPQISARADTLSGQLPLAAMPRPDLERAAALPTPAEIDAAPQLPMLPPGAVLDAATLRWARDTIAGDLRTPPVPQRLSARDLVQSPPRPGIPAMISGQVADTAPAALGSEPGYLRVLVALDEGQFAEALAPPDAEVVIGSSVQVVGRFIGIDRLPAQGAAPTEVAVPLIAARVVRRAAPEASAEALAMTEWSGAGPFTMPDGLFDDIDDERTFIETRPYYYLLGQVRLEQSTPAAYAEALDLNQRGNDVHQDPAAFRGKPVRVSGIVFRAWEDHQIAQDKPFGIERVQRIMVYSMDFGPITEVIKGETITRERPVQRLFELAVIGSQPIPNVGDKISVTGRFLKFHAIPVPSNAARDQANRVQRQSDKAYLYLVVAPAYVVPAPPVKAPLWGWFEIAIAVTVVVLGVVFWFVSRRERESSNGIHTRAKEMRRTRFEIATKSVSPAAPAASTPPASTDGAPANGTDLPPAKPPTDPA